MGYLYASQSRYDDLERICGELSNVYLTNELAIELVDRLCKDVTRRSLKLRGRKVFTPKIWFRGFRQSGVSFSGKIHLSNSPSIYLIIHELAHEIHGQVRCLVPKPNHTHGLADHHGVEYQKNLEFLRDLVRGGRYKKFNTYKGVCERAPKRKIIKRVTPLDDGTFDIRLKPKVVDELRCSMCIDGVPEKGEEFYWFNEKLQKIGYKGGVVNLTHQQAKVISTESDYTAGRLWDDERYLRDSLYELSESIDTAIRKSQISG